MSFILQDVATKQRAEQIRMMDCKRPRYSREIELSHVQHCLDRQQDPR